MSHELAALVLGAFAAAFATGVAGFGNALVAAAIWLPFLPPRDAVPLIVITGVVMQAWAIRALATRPVAGRLGPMIAGGILGTPLGLWLLSVAEPAPFRRAVGVILCAYGGLMLLFRANAVTLAPPRTADAAVGVAAGVLGGFAGLSGILPTVWCGLRGWTPGEQRAVYQPVQLVLGLCAVAGLAAAGLIGAGVLRDLALTLPAIAAGVWLGHRLYARLDAAAFRTVVLALVLASGAGLLL